MRSQATTVRAYLDELPTERRRALSAVRTVVRKNLPRGVVERMAWGMISYEVPLTLVPDTYNGKPLVYAGLASQQRYMALYLTAVYADPALREWFTQEYRATGLRMDVGKSCVRFRTLDDLPLDLVGRAVAACTVDEFVAAYRRAR